MNWQSGIYHSPCPPYLEPASGSSYRLLLRTQVAPQNVFLRTTPDGEQRFTEARPAPRRARWDCDWWEVTVAMTAPSLAYRFLLLTDQGALWHNAAGTVGHVPTDEHDFQILSDPQQPAWLPYSVFYQIFPERFDDGDPANNPNPVSPWGQLPDPQKDGHEFFGGDLQGIARHLDYIHDRVGATALYLNPIFTAPSNHKYDVASYTQVDPHFGGDEAFLALRRGLQERGMHLMLDIVPNHCGREHPWFQAALKDPHAPSAEFFTFHDYPDDYEAWLGVRSLPKLNYASQRLREEMYAGPQAIMRRWLRAPYSIDGWRVDASNMVGRQGATLLGHEVIRGMRQAVKQENPNAYFIGENFFDASSYLQGDQFDATMNYRGFMLPLYHWLIGHDLSSLDQAPASDSHPLPSAELAAQWLAFRATIPTSIGLQQLNLLGSHDTRRLLTAAGQDRQLAATARTLLFTFPGVPSVYYGDEVGLQGGRDPDNRRTMPWDQREWDTAWLEGWHRHVRLRCTAPALAVGAFQLLLAEQDTLAFLRESPEQRLVVVARRASDGVATIPVSRGALPDGSVWREWESGERATVSGGQLAVPATRSQVWMEV